MVVLASGAEDADIAIVRERGAELRDNEGDAGGFTDWVFFTDKDIERFARGGFAKPRFEIIKKFCVGLDAGDLKKFGLSKEARDTGEVKLVADCSEAEITGQFN